MKTPDKLRCLLHEWQTLDGVQTSLCKDEDTFNSLKKELQENDPTTRVGDELWWVTVSNHAFIEMIERDGFLFITEDEHDDCFDEFSESMSEER